MSNTETKKCLFCGNVEAFYSSCDSNHVFIECDTCGRVEINTYTMFQSKIDKNQLPSYLYYNGKINKKIDHDNFFNFIGMEAKFKEIYEDHPYCYNVTKDIVENWYPKTFSEKIDLILLGLDLLSNHFGEYIKLTKEQVYSAFFTNRYVGEIKLDDSNLDKQKLYIIKYLKELEYISEGAINSFLIRPKGLERINEIQKQQSDFKTVFVAMSFDSDMKGVREKISNAITKVGYIPRIMDEIQHNHQIVPEMLYEIKQSKFVVAELTGHNNGAYFEAGYALGMGKEVIQLCKKEAFEESAHFDVKQINTILWDSEEHIEELLSKRIIATII